jgi:hypothetical protein
MARYRIYVRDADGDLMMRVVEAKNPDEVISQEKEDITQAMLDEYPAAKVRKVVNKMFRCIRCVEIRE